MQRGAGVLLPVFSLPANEGMGTFGKTAFEFVSLLHKNGFKYWQILPLIYPGKGFSPYLSPCLFGMFYGYIDCRKLHEKGLITKAELSHILSIFPPSGNTCNYDLIKKHKLDLIYPAYHRAKNTCKFEQFKTNNAHWIYDHALFFALYRRFKAPFYRWHPSLKLRDKNALHRAFAELEPDIDFFCFLQYAAFSQWFDLKQYANSLGISIIGDLPFYPALNSVEVWAHREIFDLKRVSGCPPDNFSACGQVWNSPVYDTHAVIKSGLRLHINRFEHSLKLFDCLRADHFRGYEAFWSIPKGKPAASGQWENSFGSELFDALIKKHGKLPIIAEDLGTLTDSYFEFAEKYDFPSTRVIQFAFDNDACSRYLPSETPENSVIYTGTHDNNTLKGWAEEIDAEKTCRIYEYLGTENKAEVMPALIRACLNSKSRVCIFPMQDILGQDKNARINTPGAVNKHNWRYRLTFSQLNDDTFSHIRDSIILSGR